jgi:hypothetical protein
MLLTHLANFSRLEAAHPHRGQDGGTDGPRGIDAVACLGYLRPAHTPGPIRWRLGMTCPRCQHENPPQAKFCLECGARVALTCTKCRSELPAGAKFCLE